MVSSCYPPAPQALRRPLVMVLAVCVALFALAPATAAQRRPQAEFVRQILVLAPLHTDGESRAAQRVAAALREALRDGSDREQLSIVGADSVGRMLRNVGFPQAGQAGETEQLLVARAARGDELLVSQLREFGDTLELRSTLILVRDPRVREPLPAVRAVGHQAVARAMARTIGRARTQGDFLRRCENAARVGDASTALREGERALRGYPNGLLARSCLVRVLASVPVPRDSIVAVADFIIARDSANIIAHTMRAQALSTAGRTGPATAAWQRVVALKADSLDLAVEAVESLFRLSRPREALAAADLVAVHHASALPLRRQRFRALHALARWTDAAALGDSLERADDTFANEPVFIARYVESLKMRGDTLRALAKSARSVAEHPTDGRLYVQYLELISGENQVALARGLAKFPSLGALRVLAAQRARASGDERAERAELSAAVAVDASQSPVYLRLAELWFRDGRADSALVVLAQAPRTGASATMLRTYVVSRGLEMLRGSVDSLPDTYTVPMGLLMLADSIDSGEDSRRLVVAASLQQARAYLVVGASGRSCEPLQLASVDLATASQALERGVGAGAAATELVEAHEGLSTAVGDAERVLCGPRPLPGS